ncbi:MAG: hypothetical protein ABMB14_10980, partial [Myxococcota bacterium]
GEIRALALGAVIRAVRHDRAALPDALAVVARRRFEQDPVRAAMLGALAGLPHAVWSAAALPALGEVLGHAWDAADLSPATAGYAEQLVVRGFRHDPAWGARALARSLAVRGTIVTDGLLDGLPIASRRSLLPALAEAARGWTTRERWVAVQWVCRQVERDLRHAPGLVALLVEIAREVPYPGHTAAALALLARWDRAAFEPLADALLAADRSAAALGPIGTYVATRGQRWLDRVLAAPLAGRWATGRSWWTTYSGFATWSEDDQAQYAATLRAHVGDSGQPVSALAWPVTQLAALGWTDPAPLIALADDPRPPIRDWAVQAIGRLDADVAVPALLRFLDDDRARRAILALGPRLGELPPDRALAVLLAAPRTRVTVAKEIARRIGDLGTDEAHRALLAIAAEPLHRDVTIAVLRGLWSHLDRDETWAVFARAAASPDVVLASRLAEIGTEALSPAADARFCDLLASLVARPEDELRVRVLRALHRAPIRDPSRTLLRALIARIGDPAVRSRDERTAVVTAAVLRANLEDADAIAVRLAGCADVHALLDGIAPLSGTSWLDPRVDRVRRRLAEALGEDAALVPIALRLWGQREAEALVAALRRLAGRGWLGFDALVSAMGAIGASPDPDAIERTLRSDPDPTLARLGLAALEHAAGRDDLDRWTEDRRTALDAYRSHPSPAVHGPARMVRPPG